MEYTKQTWTAPTGTGLSRYAKSGESASHVTLTLDPENLTNTPTPFTMARMAHMEDGIAKAYDTAPPTPWAQYSGKDIPQLPDNVAGTTYKRDNDWTTTDGWTASGGTVSVGDNKLICFSSTGDPYITKSGFSFSGASNRFIYLYVSEIPAGNILGQVYYSTSGHGISQSYVKDFTYTKKGINILDMSVLSAGGTDWLTSTITGLRFDLGNLAGKTFIIQSIYIGDGAYDRLVFDNSYHYRHLLNNAVVPTPQGLYFNGKTSYLRSKEPVTLPDVFTFSATVNCAVNGITQAFCCIGDYTVPSIPSIWIVRRASNYDLFIPISDGTAQIASVNFVNYFSGYENIDIDVKVEIDFVSKTIKAYRNGIQFGSVISSPTMIKPVADYMFLGTSATTGTSKLLGYMRNICIFDTALTDTQRNWLAQGNTPPILYDVTNYDTEGYVSIQDADGTNTGVAVSVDSNGNRILKLPATIKANVTGIASGNSPTSHASAATTYGVSSEANYGHAKASTVAGSANGTASKGTTPAVFAQSNHVHPLQTSVSGNAGTADKWKTARNFTISDADGTNTGTAVSVDGSENETLKLPATIKANVTGNADATSDSFVGMIAAFSGTADFSSWLFCDGRAVSRTQYSKLFARIGITWGAGNTTTTFNLPDLREVTLVGAGDSPREMTDPDVFTVAQFKDATFKSHTHNFTIFTKTTSVSKDGPITANCIIASGATNPDTTPAGSTVTRANSMGVGYFIRSL